MKKKYTRKQITEAIAYWQKRLVAEAKDPSGYKSFDSLKKTLDAEIAKMASTSRPDLEKIKYIYDNYDEDDRFEYDLRDVDNYSFGQRLKLPSGSRLNDKIIDFYSACESLVQGAEPIIPMEFEDNFIWHPLNSLFLAAIEQDQKKASSIIAQNLNNSKMQQWFDADVIADTDEEDGKTVEYYKYEIRLDWKEGLAILREYAKKFYDVWAKNFWRLDHRQFTVNYTAWHMDKYFVKIEAADEDEAKKKFFKDHAHEEYDMKDFEITSIQEN